MSCREQLCTYFFDNLFQNSCVQMFFFKPRPGARFSKVPKIFLSRKAIRKLRSAYSVKLVFSYVVKGIKITAKFGVSRRLRFEDTKRIMSPEIRPKSFGTFEEQAMGPGFYSRDDRLVARYDQSSFVT